MTTLGKIISVRTEHPVPAPGGFTPGRTTILASDVDTMEATSLGVLYAFEDRRVLVPWSSIRFAEYGAPIAKVEPEPQHVTVPDPPARKKPKAEPKG